MSIYVEFAIILLVSIGLSVIVYVIASRARVNWKLFLRISLSSRALDSVFFVVVIAFFALFAILDIQRFESFNIFGYDFAVFDQAVWNSMHGRLFESTIIADAPFVLGLHFSPILIALVPLYVLSRPWLNVILPALTIAVAAFPLYWFARARIGRVLALCVVIAFFLSSSIQYRALDQYFDVIWTTPLMMLAAFFLLRRRYVPLLVCLGLGFLCREEMAFVAVGVGLFIAIFQHRLKLGLGLAFASLVWAILLLEFVMPFLNGRNSYYFFSGNPEWGSEHYGYLGSNLPEIVLTLITRPDVVLQHLLVQGKIVTVVQLFMPLGLLSLLGAEVSVLALPTLGYTLLSDVEGNYVLNSHLYAPALPFLFLGAVVGIRRILDWWAQNLRAISGSAFADRFARQAAVSVLILTASVSTYLVDAPGPLGRNFLPSRYTATEHHRLGDAIVNMIPQDAVVVTQEELAPHLSERRYLYIMPGIPCLPGADYLFVDTTRPWYGYQQSHWQMAFMRGYFETVFEQDGYILKKYTPRAQLDSSLDVHFGEDITLLGYTLPLTGTVSGGQILSPYFAWRVSTQVPERYVVQVHLTDSQNRLWAQFDRVPCRGFIFPNQRNAAEVFNDDASLRLPPTMPPGDYRLTLAILDEKTNRHLDVRDASGRVLGSEFVVMTLHIEKNKASFKANELFIEQPLYVDMREMRFLGYVSLPREIKRGEVLEVGLYWRARSKPQGDYIVAVQLRDAAGRIAFEHTARPANGTYPTTQWEPGEVLLDWHDFVLPQEIAVGEYQLFVVLQEEGSKRSLGETKISNLSITR